MEKLPDSRLDQIFKNYIARSHEIRNLRVVLDQHKIDRLAEELYEYLISETQQPEKVVN